VYANIARIKDQRSVHFAIACHPGKDESKGVRGSSAARGDFDIEIVIGGHDTRTATITSNNDGPVGHFAAFRPDIANLGLDEDGDDIDVCLAEPLTDYAAPSAKDKKTWARSLTVFRNALTNTIATMGCERRPYPDGPLVRTVELKWVRGEFFKEYPIDPDKTLAQQNDARKHAFGRAVADAQGRELIKVREVEGVPHAWLAA
jgi:hypothetical protein